MQLGFQEKSKLLWRRERKHPELTTPTEILLHCLPRATVHAAFANTACGAESRWRGEHVTSWTGLWKRGVATRNGQARTPTSLQGTWHGVLLVISDLSLTQLKANGSQTGAMRKLIASPNRCSRAMPHTVDSGASFGPELSFY